MEEIQSKEYSAPERLSVAKTKKLYIGGAFPRSESGRSFPVAEAKSGNFFANIAQASRKDFRNAVEAARKAQHAWVKKTSYNRGQILYRMAEMLEPRQNEIIDEIVAVSGATKAQAKKETETAIDRLVWYSGWADKYAQMGGNHNPVAGSFFNFTVTEPTGVVAAVSPDFAPLLGFVSQIAPIITGGNSVIALVSEKYPSVAVSFAEILATSDLPGGVVNILTGFRKEILPIMASHMDINGLDLANVEADLLAPAQQAAVENLKRVRVKTWKSETDLYSAGEKLDYILDFQEYKTIWHPIGV